MAPISGRTYVIINKKSGTALDLSGDNQTSIIGFTSKRSDNQKWALTESGNGWTFRNVYNGKYLDLPTQGSYQDGEPVVATENPRKWDIFPDEHDSNGFRIFVPGTHKNIDLSDHGNPTPGTLVVIWGRWNGDNQVWRFEEA